MTAPSKAPEVLTTPRLLLRRPVAGDAEPIFRRYASDRECLRYIAWPAHESVADTRAFLETSDAEWSRSPAGPYLVFSRADLRLLGGTGLAFDSPVSASTGYVLARDSWGKGFATEALLAIVGAARGLGVRRLWAFCHSAHRPSQRVLEKGGFVRESTLERHLVFPNLGTAELQDVLRYVLA